MVDKIVTPRPINTPSQSYRLPEADRQAILARADSARRIKKIERQRQNFIKRFGCDGTEENCA